MKVHVIVLGFVLSVHTNSFHTAPAFLSEDNTFDGSLSCLQKCALLTWCQLCRFGDGEHKCSFLDAMEDAEVNKKESGGMKLTKRLNRKGGCRGPSCNSLSTGNLTVFKEYKTWEEARKTCSTNSRLVVVKSPEKQKILEKLARSHELRFVWIGAKDFNKTNLFEWLDGYPMNYTAWASGEPSHVPVLGFRNLPEDCVELNHFKHYQWNDENCENNNTFICENV